MSNSNTASPPLRAVGYRRVSMREQVDGFSLDAQENNIARYAEDYGWELLEIYMDAGISAKKGSRRPAFEQLMKDAQNHKFDIVIVDKVDRFYRHLNGLLTTLDLLNSYGVSFVSVQEHLDFTTPWGKLMLTVLGTLAEIYIDNLRQEVKKGKRQRARQGLWLGAIPFGYCNGLCSKCTDPNGENYCPDFGKLDKSNGKIMVPHPVESRIVRMAFDWYITGKTSDRVIADRLNETMITLANGYQVPARQKGAPGRTGPRPFSRDLIRDMLNRVAYTGKVPYQGVADDGRHRKRKAPLDLFPSSHVALVDDGTFEQAHRIRELKGQTPLNEFHAARIYPLTGILRCGFCGGTMRGVTNDHYRYYRDSNQQDRVCHCSQNVVNAEMIEQQVLCWLKNIVQSASNDAEQHVVDQCEELETRFERAKQLYLAGEISRQVYEAERAKLDVFKKDLHADECRARISSINIIAPQLARWSVLSQYERKSLFRLTIETGYLRENAFVAVQPTIAFLPLTRSYTARPSKGCNCGEGGIRTRD
jgi:site-specific DNA recombinase